MRTGDLDGLGVLYNSDGQLVCEPGERVLKRYEHFYAHIARGWGNWVRTIVFDSRSGEGTVFVTDRRLVFIRRPNPWETLKSYGNPYGMPTGIVKSMKAKDVLEAGGKEYCEVRYNDIMRYQKKRWGARFFILAGEERFRTGVDCEMFTIIEPFLRRLGIREGRT